MLYIVLEKKKNKFSGIFIGLAIAIKIFPAVFLLMSFSMKRYSTIFVCLLSFMIFNFIGFLGFNGGIANIAHSLSGLMQGMQYYKTIMIDRFNYIEGVSFNHSFFSILRYLSLLGFNINLTEAISTYINVVLALLSAIIVIIYRYTIDLWKVLTISAVIVCLFPIVSADYKLLYLLLPLPYYLVAKPDAQNQYILYSALWGLILSPKFFIWYKHQLPINAMVNAGCLIIFLTTIFIFERPEEQKTQNEKHVLES